MARVYMGTQPWGVLQDSSGNVQASVSVTVKNRDTTNATHWSARTGGSSSTGSFSTTSSGILHRWIAPGEYTLTVGGTTYDVEAVSGSSVPNAEWDQTAPADRDEPAYSSTLAKVKFRPPADVVLNSLNFPGLDPTGATSSGAAIDAAIAACIPATDPATTTRNATRRLHIPPGTYMRNDGQPVFSLRSVQGFNLRTGGPWCVRFVGGASATSIAEFNGISRSHFDGFSVDTTGTPTIQRGVWIYWDNTAASPTQSARSTLESRFEFIEATNNGRWITGMQIGRDGDTNQVDSLSFGHVMIQGGGKGDATFWQSAIKVGSSATGNNLLHAIQFLAAMSCNRGLHIARSGVTVEKAQLQANAADILIDGPPNAECSILSGRSENSERLIDSNDHGSAAAFVSLSDFKFNAQAINADGQWIRYRFPGILRLSNVQLWAPGAVVPKIYLTATRRQYLIADGLSSEQAESTLFAAMGADVAVRMSGYVQNAAAAIPVGPIVQDVAAAATITLPYSGDVTTISGTATITTITATGHAGRTVTLIITGTAGMTDGSNLRLNGNLTGAANTTITLACDGTNWYETGRSAN